MARYSGNFGAVYVFSGSFVKVLDVYDWTFEAHTTMLNASIKGDTIERFTPSHSSGVRFTAKRRTQGVATVFPAFVIDSAVNATQTRWRLDLVDNDSTFFQIDVKGYAMDVSNNAPSDAASDETFTLQIDESFAYNH